MLINDNTAKTSDPIALLQISLINQVIAGIKPKSPEAIQKASIKNPRAKVLNDAKRRALIVLRSLIT